MVDFMVIVHGICNYVYVILCVVCVCMRSVHACVLISVMCMYVCMYVYIYICICICICICIYIYIYHNVCKSYLGNIWHVLVQNIQQEILYLLFGKWPPRPSGAVRQRLYPQICSLYIDLPLCKNWCFYQKMHNRLAYLPHKRLGISCFW